MLTQQLKETPKAPLSGGDLRPPPCCPIHCGSTPPSEPPKPPRPPFTYRSGWQPSRGENHDIPVNAIHSEPTNSDLMLLIHLGCAVTVGQLAPGVPEPLVATSPPKLGPLSLTASLTTVHTNTTGCSPNTPDHFSLGRFCMPLYGSRTS